MPPHGATSWKELVLRMAPEWEPSPPADQSRLAAVEPSLGLQLPESLRDFLTEADGRIDEFGAGVIWPATEIERHNREFRSADGFRALYMPFDHLLFFGKDVSSDLFAFAVHADGFIHKHDVFRWDHESDGRSWYAARLEQFLERRVSDDG